MFVSARSANLAIRGLLVAVLILLVAAALGLIALRLSGWQLLSVQTASMQPAFRPGDAVMIAPISTQSLHIGDIISYRSLQTAEAEVIISHRLQAIDRRTGALTTAGDALRTPDEPFPPRQVVGRPFAVAPRLGYVLDLLRRPLGLAVAIYLPAIAIIGLEIRRLLRHFGRPRYQLLQAER